MSNNKEMMGGEPEQATPAAERPPRFEFKDEQSLQDYLTWKQNVPSLFRGLVESSLKQNPPGTAVTGLPRTDQFLEYFSRALGGETVDLEAADKITANLLKPLYKVGTQAGYLNVFDTLNSPDISWNLKLQLYNAQIKPALEWLSNRDLAEASHPPSPASEQATTSPDQPEGESSAGEADQNDVPPLGENISSSMESDLEQKEGKPKALFSVRPFYGGYYKQNLFYDFDPDNLKWGKPENEFSPADQAPLDTLSERLLSGKIRGGESLALPLPYDWVMDTDTLVTNAPADSYEITRNQDGLWYLNVESPGVFEYEVRAGKRQRLEPARKFTETKIAGQLPEELTAKISELAGAKLPPLKHQREIVKLVRSHLTYSNSNQAWQSYAASPENFFAAIWQAKEADCFVANTMAIRALKEAGFPARLVSGYYVKEKGEADEAIMHAGNGHAWLEVWDELSYRPVRLDATPKGDPTMDESKQEAELEGNESGEGDYGASDEIASEEEIKKQLAQMKKPSAGGSQSKPTFEMVEQSFAEVAGCTPEQAREFFAALERVRQIKDEKTGLPITDLLKEEWQKIVSERKVEQNEYRGPVRMDEGDRLEDPVAAMVDIKSKEYNPTGFEKDERVQKVETDFGGLNQFFSFDLSGSMSEPDPASGRQKADVQRDAALLFIDSLMQCATISRRASGETEVLPLKIMVTLASSRGDVKLHLTDKWGAPEQWAFYSALTRLASGGTPTHQTLKLIEMDFDKELEELKKKRLSPEKMPINYTAEISDGAPDDFATTEEMHRVLKAKGMAIRSYTIGGQSASADAAPPLQSFSELPSILAKDILELFKKLRPRRIKK